nr:MAG TPA: hypothetical protein [Caudoviricetes sp.]
MCNKKSNIFSNNYMSVTALLSMIGGLLDYFQCADMHNPALSSR